MLQTPAVLINEPEGQLSPLSNFFLGPLDICSWRFASVEHYFQSQKYSDTAVVDRILATPDAAAAKQLSWAFDQSIVRPDWEKIRNNVMLKALRAKFNQDEFAKDLLKCTWPMPIFEDSISDNYWGIGSDGKGMNFLGKLMMIVRDELLGFTQQEPEYVHLPLSRRPPHGRESRYAFVPGIESKSRVQKGFGPRFSDLMPNALTAISIPTLVIDWIRKQGVSVQNDLLEDAKNTIQGLILRLATQNPSLSSVEIEQYVTQAAGNAFDQKYSSYRWADDARFLEESWEEDFISFLSSKFGDVREWTPGLIVGAGAGEEAKHIWRRFGPDVLLVDVGRRLVQNCRIQAPKAKVLLGRAESLIDIPTSSIGLYCALRVYQSAYFDIDGAIAEASRVLRSGGGIVISISNAYVGVDKKLIRGRIVDGQAVDLTSASIDLCTIASKLSKCGFDDLELKDFRTEWIITGRKAN